MYSSTTPTQHNSQPQFVVTHRYRSQTEEERQHNLQSIVMQYLSHRLSQPQEAEDDLTQ